MNCHLFYTVKRKETPIENSTSVNVKEFDERTEDLTMADILKLPTTEKCGIYIDNSATEGIEFEIEIVNI